jgi:hypothetical protein
MMERGDPLYFGGPTDSSSSQDNPSLGKAAAIAHIWARYLGGDGEELSICGYRPSHFLDVAIAHIPDTAGPKRNVKAKYSVRAEEDRAEIDYPFSWDQKAKWVRRYERIMTQPAPYLDVAVENLRPRVRKVYFDVLMEELRKATLDPSTRYGK